MDTQDQNTKRSDTRIPTHTNSEFEPVTAKASVPTKKGVISPFVEVTLNDSKLRAGTSIEP